MDPRTKDAIRKTSADLEVVKINMETLKKDNKYMKGVLREIKNSVVRGYKKDKK